MSNENVEIPSGYRADAKGHLIPLSMIKPIDLERDKLVCGLAEKAKATSDLIAELRVQVFGDINAFVEKSNKVSGVKRGGKKGNLTLYSFDGRFKIQVAIAERMRFDERLQAAKQLVDECILDWSEGSNDKMKVLVHGAFQTDKAGMINTGQVLSLRRYNIKDAKWKKAMVIIGESLQLVGSKEYVRFYERVASSDQYLPISLDMATA